MKTTPTAVGWRWVRFGPWFGLSFSTTFSTTFGLMVLLAASLAGAAHAATLTMQVIDKEGNVVPDTAVLVRYAVSPVARPENPSLVTVEQSQLRFRPYLSIVKPGATLRFTNLDAFDHHVRGTAPTIAGAPGKDFEARIGPSTTKTFEAQVTDLGLYTLSCHLHSRMRGYVLVTDTPWFAKTDAAGRVTLDNLPEGAVDVQLWHPEQFVDQPVQRAQLGKSPSALEGQLNFTPRTRRAS